LKKLEQDRDALAFFENFLLGNLIYKINENGQIGEVDKETEITNPETWPKIYHLAVEVAYNVALRNHSEAHLDIFEVAGRAIKALRQELEEKQRIELDVVGMKSPTEIMADAGYVKVTDGIVELTEKVNPVALDIERITQGRRD
jgi:hypothetical protein